MHSSENAIYAIARCGGYFKSSIIKHIIKPNTFFVYLSSHGELKPLYKRAHCVGETIYFLPPKYVTPWWSYRPQQANEFSVFRSFALIRYYAENRNLPYTGELLKSTFPKHIKRTFNGLYASLDENTNEKIIIILDFFKTLKKLISMIDVHRAYFDIKKAPKFHVVTPRGRFPLLNELKAKRPTERIEVFSYPELAKIV